MEIVLEAEDRLRLGGRTYRCAIGRSGVSSAKREGDGATPAGIFPLRRVVYRADRMAQPETRLPVRAMASADGWCDDPSHADYNRAVSLPHAASCEPLWREDALYDLLVVLGHNDDPVRAGLGSAIFLHLARPDFGPTQGCLALSLDDLLRIVGACAPGACLRVNPPRVGKV